MSVEKRVPFASWLDALLVARAEVFYPLLELRKRDPLVGPFESGKINKEILLLDTFQIYYKSGLKIIYSKFLKIIKIRF